MQTKLMAALVVAALFTACGYDGLRGTGGEAGEGATGSSEVERRESAMTVDVRMKATNAEAFTALLLRANRIEARAGDRVLRTGLAEDFVNLARDGHAWKLGTFELPESVTEVELAVHLDEVGAWEGAGAGTLRTKGQVLRVSFPVEHIRNGKAVLDLDLARSLVPVKGDELALVPVFRTKF